MTEDKGSIWIWIILQPLVVYCGVAYLSSRTTGFRFDAGFDMYRIAFTCSTGPILILELMLFLGSMALFKGALAAETSNVIYALFANIVWAAALILPILLVFTGYTHPCWGKLPA